MISYGSGGSNRIGSTLTPDPTTLYPMNWRNKARLSIRLRDIYTGVAALRAIHELFRGNNLGIEDCSAWRLYIDNV